MDIDPWPPAQAELAPGPQLLAIDTNVLINRLALVQALHKRLLASEVWLFVPHVVVRGECAGRAKRGRGAAGLGGH